MRIETFVLNFQFDCACFQRERRDQISMF